MLNRYGYDAFGKTIICEETVENCLRYIGGQYDTLTEQYYLKAHFYNPSVAGFTQEDAYYGDGLNLYAYCHNNPVNYVDSTGHEAKAAAEKNPGDTNQRTPDQQTLYDLVGGQKKKADLTALTRRQSGTGQMSMVLTMMLLGLIRMRVVVVL